MADTMAVICPSCNGFVYLSCREMDPKDAAEAAQIMADMNGTMRMVLAADVRSGAIPACKCCRGASEQDQPLFTEEEL